MRSRCEIIMDRQMHGHQRKINNPIHTIPSPTQTKYHAYAPNNHSSNTASSNPFGTFPLPVIHFLEHSPNAG